MEDSVKQFQNWKYRNTTYKATKNYKHKKFLHQEIKASKLLATNKKRHCKGISLLRISIKTRVLMTMIDTELSG